MKKILKNNQVIITALVVMIAVAGYLTMSQRSKGNFANDAETMKTVADQATATGEEGQVLDNELYLALEDATDVSSAQVTQEPVATNEPAATNTAADGVAKDEFADISADDIGNDSIDVADAQAAAETDAAGDAVLVSNTIDADFFSSAKVTREQTRAKNKETLMDIVNNATLTEDQKQNAINNIIEMTEDAKKESAAEILLEAKGFHDVVISIVDGGADVLINADNLTEQQMAQIEDIVKRKTGIAAEKIVITPVGVVEQ